ncbi:MAG: DUF4837 family protein, partial [Cyclobacteriaceae bacterium]
KHLFLGLILSFFFASPVFSQYQLGFYNSNYGGVSSIRTNPANAADNRMKFQLNLVNTGFNFSNNYLVTETSVPYKPVLTRVINFNGKYAVEMKGLWKTNIPSMGGPFIGFAFVDEEKGYFYYIEGFVFSPSKPQREILRELEVILSTFSTEGKKEESEKSS